MTKELKETIEGMTSKDYKVRFIAEYEQLKIRIDKLYNYIIKIKTENAPHDCPVELLKIQLKGMLTYLNILEIRANIEKINLN